MSTEGRPVLAVGGIVLRGEPAQVCLIRRGHAPAAGSWSLPGGRVEAQEGLTEALRRELREETGLDVEVGPLIEVIELFGERHYVVLDYLCALVDDGEAEVAAGDDADEARFVPVAELSRFDVSDAVERVVLAAVAYRSLSARAAAGTLEM